MANLPYNEKDITSIFNYSKQLVNKCLRDFAPDAEVHRGKGSLGQLVEELFFKYDLNSRQEADFAFVNAELKCTPLKKSAKEELLIKERLVCSLINYTSDWNKSFEESHFYHKCLIMLIMFYLHNPKVSKLDLQFLFAVLWKIPEKDLLIIRKDYDTIITKIRNGQAHTLSEGDTMYLGACRKGQKGDSLMPQHKNKIYSSHFVQYARHLISSECVCNLEMSISEYALRRHSSEQKVRLSSTSHPSSIR